MKPALRRAALLVLLAAAVIAGLVYAFQPVPVLVDLAPVVRGPLVVTVAEEGRTRLREVFVVSAPIAGRLRRIEPHAGDRVDAGTTVLAVLEPASPPFLDARAQAQAAATAKAAEAARDLAAAELDKAQAEAAFAAAEHDRIARLVSQEAASRRALEVAAMELRARKAAVATAEAALRLKGHELDTARALLLAPGDTGAAACCVLVVAPVTGAVLRVLQESEAVVAAGTALIELGDPTELEVVAELLSTAAVQVRPGAAVEIDGWGGAAPLTGQVHRIEPFGFTKMSALGVEEQRVRVVIDLTSPAATYRSLGHGYRVDVRIVVWRGEDVVKAPVGALFRDGERWAVFAAADGRARLRPVEVGRLTDLEAEILGGLTPGEQVVTHPSDRVGDGVAIAAR